MRWLCMLHHRLFFKSNKSERQRVKTENTNMFKVLVFLLFISNQRKAGRQV
jgi:hypothetical protein